MDTTTLKRRAKRVLIFDASKKLCGVCQSQVKLARIFDVRTPTVKAVCDGEAISTCKHYLRWWDENIEIDVLAELGTLTLREYDSLCGVKRRVYRNTEMSRKGMKYNMKSTPKKLKDSERRNRKRL